jgi:hypothetical protein
VAKRRGFREMELELFGYLGDLKPGDVSHPARCEATRLGVLVQAHMLLLLERVWGSHRGQMPDQMIAAFLRAPKHEHSFVSLD